ncbi:MAG TPA: FliH/SctL family protein [Bryobacteraceae bacterium]|nr:FliH/SctL family protein [Bryobacteraceae bacterium]
MSEVLAGHPLAVASARWRTVSLAAARNAAGAAAEDELIQRIEQARREGQEEGLRKGRADIQRLLPSTLENISATLAELKEQRQQLREEACQELVRLAVSVARRVIHRETVVDSAAIAGLVKAALAKLQSREISRVRMHPALESTVSRVLEEGGAPAHLVLLADASLSPGDLLFETPQGVLDASVSTQFGELERALLDKLGSASVADRSDLHLSALAS